MQADKPAKATNIFLGVILFLAVFALNGCEKAIIGVGREPQKIPPATAGTPPTQAQPVLDQAQAAIQAGDFQRAEQLATAYSNQPGLAGADLTKSLRILAQAAVGNKHPKLALAALDRWKQAQPDADKREDWQRFWFDSLQLLPESDALARASAMREAKDRPWLLQAEAGLFLASRDWKSGREAQAMRSLADIYGQARNKEYQAELEQRLFAELRDAGPAVLDKLYNLLTPENENYYPYALVRLETARRQALDPRTYELAQETLAQMRDNAVLADSGLLESWAGQAAGADVKVVPLPGKAVVLALPLSGEYSGLARRIVRGARQACAEFKRDGYQTDLYTVDTDQPDWLSQLAGLPENAVVVGGPMRAADYLAVKSSGNPGRRVFMAFMSNLEEGDEGSVAWRFFSSPKDQINALLRFSQALGVHSYGTLSPQEPYGERMTALFSQQAYAQGGSISGGATYPPDKPEAWNSIVASFLRTNKKAENPPSPPFRAVFLPDSWNNAEILVPHLFYFRETRQILLGTSLWEQGLAAKQYLDARYYNLTVFPGAWKFGASSPAGEALQAALASANPDSTDGADFWSGLGYDFARFSVTLDIGPGWTPQSVNAALAGHRPIPWSSAPLRWNAGGQAEQELFLLTPTSEGIRPVDLESFRAAFEKAWGAKK